MLIKHVIKSYFRNKWKILEQVEPVGFTFCLFIVAAVIEGTMQLKLRVRAAAAAAAVVAVSGIRVAPPPMAPWVEVVSSDPLPVIDKVTAARCV